MIHMEYYLVVSTIMMFAGIYGFFTRRNTAGRIRNADLCFGSGCFYRFGLPDCNH